MWSVEQAIRPALVEAFPDATVSVSVGQVALTTDRVIVVTALATPVDGTTMAGKWTVDVTCLSRGDKDVGDVFRFAGQAMSTITSLVDSGRVPDLVAWHPLTLPVLAENTTPSRGHVAVRFALDIVAYYGD